MNRIKLYRKKLGLSQSELALSLGIGRTRLANFENGTRVPSLEMSRELAAGLSSLGAKCDLDDVFPPKKNAA